MSTNQKSDKPEKSNENSNLVEPTKQSVNPVINAVTKTRYTLLQLGLGVAILSGIVVLLFIIFSPKPEVGEVSSMITNTSQRSGLESRLDPDGYSTEPCEYTNLRLEHYEESGVPKCHGGERESWKNFMAVFEEVCDAVCPERMPVDESGKSVSYIEERFNLDTSQEADYDYMYAMIMIIMDYKGAIIWGAGTLGDEQEIDARAIKYAQQLKDVWNRFLAHEDLDYTFDIQFDDHSFVYDGKYVGTNHGVKDYVPRL